MISPLTSYTPPAWAAGLGMIPTSRVILATRPTPLQVWTPPSVPNDVTLSIKRDDMTGMTLSGNKARKLEFLMADALERGSDTVITCGGIQSNHARATAVAARELGLDSHLVLNSASPDTDPGLSGNLLLDRLVGAELHLITFAQYHQKDAVMSELADELRRAGHRPYVIPEGGSNALGAWGYMEAVRELMEQLGADGAPTDIVSACGSGGTTAGLALGARLAGLPTRVHAVNVCWDADHFEKRIVGLFRALGSGESVASLVDIIDGYVGRGYAQSRPEELDLLQRTARATGIILDPVYTGKAFFGLCRELERRPGRFAGRQILFVHTGGLFGLYDKLSEFSTTRIP